MFVFGLLLFSLSLSAHELGHAFAMRHYGVAIKEISIFGFGPKLFKFKIRRWFGDTPLYIKLIPIGAYVEPANQDFEKNLTFSQKTHINGGGVIANVLFASVLYAIGYLGSENYNLNILIILILGLLIGLFPRFSSYIVLPAGVCLITLLVLIIFKSHPNNFADVHKNMMQNNGSIVSITSDIHKYSTDILETLKFGALMSIAVGLTQTLPLGPLDGGRIAKDVLRVIFGKYKLPVVIYSIVTTILFIYLIITAIGADILKIAQHKF